MSLIRSLENVSLDLRAALGDLEDLQEVLSTESLAATADSNSQFAAMATKFFKGMRSVHLVCNTGDHTHIIAWNWMHSCDCMISARQPFVDVQSCYYLPDKNIWRYTYVGSVESVNVTSVH